VTDVLQTRCPSCVKAAMKEDQ